MTKKIFYGEFKAVGVSNSCSNYIKIFCGTFGDFFNIHRHKLSRTDFEDGKKYKVRIIIEEVK